MADKKTVEKAKKLFSTTKEYYSEQYKRGEDDENFVYGEQWAPEDARLRKGRPMLVENHLLPYKHQVLNNIKKADLAIKFSPVDEKSDKKTAEIMQGIVRNIERISRADVAYTTAADRAISCGVGFFRVNVGYVSPKSFERKITIERILNPRMVYLDPSDLSIDGSGADFAFVYEDMPTADFERQYPDKPKLSVGDKQNYGWCTDETVRIVEYFYKHHTKKTIHLMLDGTILDDDDILDDAHREQIEESREVDSVKIKWCKFYGGDEPLETGTFDGQYIPIVPVYGEEALKDGKRVFYSLIHQARDPQRMVNYFRSATAETVALQPKAPFIGAVGSFRSRLQNWLDANVTTPAFLEYDPVVLPNGQILPPPQRSEPPIASPTLIAAGDGAVNAIRGSLGIYETAMGAQGNEVAGIAIRERRIQGDNANFHFVDNLAKSIEQCGRIIQGLIPYVYNKAQIVRIIGKNGEPQLVPVNQPYKKEGEEYIPSLADGMDGIFDLSSGEYDVAVSVESSYATQQQELADKLIELAQIDPRIMSIAGDELVKALNLPGSDTIAKRIRATIEPSVLADDPMAEKLAATTAENEQLKLGQMALEMQLKEKLDNKDMENQIKLAQVGIQRDEVAIKAAETQAKIQKMQSETSAIDVETMQEVGDVLMELLERQSNTDAELSALRAQPVVAQPTPRGFIDRIKGILR